MTALRLAGNFLGATQRTASVFLKDVGRGFFEISHNGLALVGLVVVAGLVFVAGRADLRAQGEAKAFTWLQSRHAARVDRDPNLMVSLAQPDAVNRATAADPKELTRQQAAVALWLSTRYRVAPEPISRLVKEAWSVGGRVGLDPTLILAIIAVESSFNPFAQSSVGAQGLMQVMTRVHDDKYVAFGGNHAAFDPVTNLRVGVQVLKECIARAGSIDAGLRYYVGAANATDDGGYTGRVLGEQGYLRSVASGRSVSPNVRVISASVSPSETAPAVRKEAEATTPATPAATGAGAGARDQQVALLR